ncbi:MAG TPA: hypothetical protein VFN60_13335, partial [Acidimicrobiales bacterium]|nr:hypothetical protein [Acidimicrobiales bacterium]
MVAEPPLLAQPPPPAPAARSAAGRDEPPVLHFDDLAAEASPEGAPAVPGLLGNARAPAEAGAAGDASSATATTGRAAGAEAT